MKPYFVFSHTFRVVSVNLHMNRSRGVILLEKSLAAHSLTPRLGSVPVLWVPQSFAFFKLIILLRGKAA